MKYSIKIKKIIYNLIKPLYYPTYYLDRSKINNNIMSVEDTVNFILDEGASISRFGDGEFNLIIGKNLTFQEFSKELQEDLLSVLNYSDKKFLVGIPDLFEKNSNYDYITNKFWKNYMVRNKFRLKKHLNHNRLYGNSLVSRPYMGWLNKDESLLRFEDLFKIWQDKRILIIEGNGTKFGVGNDILKNASSIKRVVIPSQNAYSLKDKILSEINRQYKGEMVLLACGPTATVLSYELHKQGIQSIDIGHLDIEYEWFLKKTMSKVSIEGKNIIEVVDGDKSKSSFDATYDKQIISRIEFPTD